MMKRLLSLASLMLLARNSSAEKPVVHCKIPSNANSCYQVHGRLAVYNGGPPNFRLWKIGTHQLLGIYSGEEDMQCTRGLACSKSDYSEAEESPILPANVQAAFHTRDVFAINLFADFEVCPLESHMEGHMQAACIESAKNLVVIKN